MDNTESNNTDKFSNSTIVIENPTPELQRFLRMWKCSQYLRMKRMKEKYLKEINTSK